MSILSNFVCALKTAAINKVDFVHVKKNNKVLHLCTALEDLGYISGFTILDERHIRVYLRFFRNKSVIRTLSLYSKPSSQIYLKKRFVSGVGVNSFIRNNSFTLFACNVGAPRLLTDIEVILLGIGGVPVVTIG